MTPKEAWYIVWANLEHCYRIRKDASFPGFDPADTEAQVICFQAMSLMQEQYDPKPIAWTDLEKRIGDPVWVQPADYSLDGYWALLDSVDIPEFPACRLTLLIPGGGTTVIQDPTLFAIYRYRPRQEGKP